MNLESLSNKELIDRYHSALTELDNHSFKADQAGTLYEMNKRTEYITYYQDQIQKYEEELKRRAIE